MFILDVLEKLIEMISIESIEKNVKSKLYQIKKMHQHRWNDSFQGQNKKTIKNNTKPIQSFLLIEIIKILVKNETWK